MSKMSKRKMEKREFEGLLCLHRDGDNYSALFLSSLLNPLADELYFMCGRQCTVRFLTSDKPCTKEEAMNGFLEEMMGAAKVSYYHQYSELTGYLWTTEELKVGGHDLIDMLRANVGKWLHLEVEVN